MLFDFVQSKSWPFESHYWEQLGYEAAISQGEDTGFYN